MTTLERTDGSVNITDAGTAILRAGTEAYFSLPKNQRNRAISEERDELGDPLVLAEEVIGNAILAEAESQFGSVVVRAEELEKPLTIGENPQWLLLVDYVDGTKALLENPEHGQFGPMIGIYPNTTPKYEECIFGGLTILNERKTLYGVKGGGAFSVTNDSEPRQIYTSGAENLDENTRLFSMDNITERFGADFSRVRKVLAAHGLQGPFERNDSSAVHYGSVATGDKDAAIEFTRKRNFEPAAGYRIVVEAGGVVLTRTRRGRVTDLGSRSYLQYGQQDALDVVIASTDTLANKILGKKPNARRFL